jgi:hypothetical protein
MIAYAIRFVNYPYLAAARRRIRMDLSTHPPKTAISPTTSGDRSWGEVAGY